MKLVFIIDQVYMHGGIERVLSIKANYFASSSENEVHIITTEQKGFSPQYKFDPQIRFEDLGINYDRNKSYFHPLNLLKLPGHIIKSRKVINKIDPDIIVVCSHSTDTYFVPFINKGIPKVKEFHYSKYIETPHRNKDNKSKKYYFLKFTDFVESKYDRLVILNNDEATYYKSNNVAIIPNPLTFYPEVISNLKSKIAIAAGRIAPVKRYDLLIDIWTKVAESNKDWQLHIYGTGESGYLKELQNKIKDTGLEEQVYFKGLSNDIQNKMLDSSLYLMTSENECFPLVLLEAQACGLPIVAFDCPHGPRNIVKKENGILIKFGDITSFSYSILSLMSQESKRIQLGKNAREHSEKFNLEIVMKHWENLFNELIEPHD